MTQIEASNRKRSDRFSLVQKWLAGIILFVILSIGSVIFLFNRIMRLGGDLETYQETKSPDGRYIATLAYRNGMTTGYYFVSLEPVGKHHSLNPWDSDPSTIVAEVAEEGLKDLAWQGSNTLVIRYVKSNATSGEGADFVQQDKRWRDVHIVYQAGKL